MGRQRLPYEVTLKRLIDCGALQAEPNSMMLEARSKVRRGDLLENGTIFFEGKTHQSASSFAVAALRSAGAKNRTSANGWQLVVFKGKTLETYRAEFIKDMWGITAPIRSRNICSIEEGSPESGARLQQQENDEDDEPPAHASPSVEPASSLSGTVGPQSSAPSGSQTQCFSNPPREDYVAEASSGPLVVKPDGSYSRKRGPTLELQLWLRKALKKRHGERLIVPVLDTPQ